jgi:hypothetical protein
MTGPATVPVKKMPTHNPQPAETVSQPGVDEARAVQASTNVTAPPASDAAKLQAAARLAANVLNEKTSEINGTAKQPPLEQQTGPMAQQEATQAQS